MTDIEQARELLAAEMDGYARNSFLNGDDEICIECWRVVRLISRLISHRSQIGSHGGSDEN